MFFDIVHPEVMTLSEGIGNMGAADALHFVEQGSISQRRPSQFGPVIPAPPRDHVIYGGEREALMVEVSVQHDGQ